MNIQELPISEIRTDKETQPRTDMDMNVVADYQTAMEEGTTFPPIVVFSDGSDFWLADGYHRLFAIRRAGGQMIMAEVHGGTKRDAILHSVGANATHGLRRTRKDKRRAVLALLNDPEWGSWPNTKIADHCGVSHQLVSVMKKENLSFYNGKIDSEPVQVERNGTTYLMETTNIGRPRIDPQRLIDDPQPVGWRQQETRQENVQEITQSHFQKLYSLDDWAALDDSERAEVVEHGLFNDNAQFNKQQTTSIEWAQWSWNPITGCKHNCPYCYARDIANRFYEQQFEPTFIPQRLAAATNTPMPREALEDIGYKNVFTCSMADLFGRWVPTEWIEAVLTVVDENPQWNFLFLTKFPIRMAEFAFPENAWVGTTVDCQARVANAENAFRQIDAAVKWLSCEPLLEPLQFESLDMFDWLVLGGSSSSSQTPEWRPPRAWINALEQQAVDADCMVYEKTNLLERIKEYPGTDFDYERQLPEALQYLPSM
jgi:protein gp37